MTDFKPLGVCSSLRKRVSEYPVSELLSTHELVREFDQLVLSLVREPVDQVALSLFSVFRQVQIDLRLGAHIDWILDGGRE